jgi:two-component system nitrogen regulation sensor histidine kinase NtrY
VTAAAALILAVAIAFFSTWYLLSPAVERADDAVLLAIILSNVAIAAAFAALIGARLWHVVSDRRNQLAGSATHMQLVWIFSSLAVVPAAIAFLFAFTILRSSLNDVFGERIENYQSAAREMANELVNTRASILQGALRDIAFDIRRNEAMGAGLEAAPISFREYLRAQTSARQLTALLLFDGERNLIARIEEFSYGYSLPSAETLQAMAREDPGGQFVFGVNDDSNQVFRGVMRIGDYGGGYLVGYQSAGAPTAEAFFKILEMRADWEEAKIGRARIERVFLAGYVVLAIIILFAAIWLALWAATRFVEPIGRLVKMSEKVSAGDLAARVNVYKNDGELGALARSMNHMTAQLQTQRDDLVETNRQFDARRRFTEAVLSGVSAGVVSVDRDGRIAIANRFAQEALNVATQSLEGARFSDVLPEAMSLFAAANEGGEHDVAGQIDVERDGRIRTLNVRIACETNEGARSFVVTFDDITALISAQRSAAWGDVARRIAHEIKNPLTPIQLSAERLRRKYAGEIKTQPEIFDRCTDTIIRHVGDIGRMVDEFSSFARMPKPVIGREDLREIVRSAVFPQRVAFPDIEFSIQSPDRPVFIEGDGRLLAQALGNLLKNAGESIASRIAETSQPPGMISVSIDDSGEQVKVAVEDNGVGLPKAERHRLTEPYMTTRAKGTGLGLAIVKKVIEEHGGALAFDDCRSLGPTGARISITLPAGDDASGQTITAAAE